MWLLNSMALEHLLSHAAPPGGLEREGGRFTGRLFDEDAWLRRALGRVPPNLNDVSRDLAACGITGITDISPRNATDMTRHFSAQMAAGSLAQSLVLAGELSLAQEIGRAHV